MGDRIKVILSFLVMVLLVALIDLYTLKSYHVISGNGDPALIWIAALIPTTVCFTKYLYKCLKSLPPHWLWTLTVISLSIAYSIWGYKNQVRHLQDIRFQMAQFFDYREALVHTQGITIYNNTVYFNYVTLFMLVSWIICALLIIVSFKSAQNSDYMHIRLSSYYIFIQNWEDASYTSAIPVGVQAAPSHCPSAAASEHAERQ